MYTRSVFFVTRPTAWALRRRAIRRPKGTARVHSGRPRGTGVWEWDMDMDSVQGGRHSAAVSPMGPWVAVPPTSVVSLLGPIFCARNNGTGGRLFRFHTPDCR